MSSEFEHRCRSFRRSPLRGAVRMPRIKALTLACVCAVAAVCGSPARADDIVAVLERSQASRLASLPSAVQTERARVVRRSFEQLAARLDFGDRLEVRVVTGPVIAECLLGRIVVANESLADLPEPVRLFLLAHEIGHAMLEHWQRMTQHYSRHMPERIEQATSQPASREFLLEASTMSQQHELAADAFAFATLRPLGYGFADLVGALTAFGMQRDTVTHPGTGKRIAHLRSLG